MPGDNLLAIDGGEPTFPNGPPDWPRSDPRVHAALTEAYQTGQWGKYHGTYCQSLVDRLQELHDLAYVHLCSSGTVAVELALRGLQVGNGDEVILGGYDFAANFRSIEAVGAKPVLVDIDASSWSLDPQQLNAALSQQTKAVIASHLHGGLVPMKRVCEWADANDVAVVEDACQASLADVDGRVAGSWGDVGILSFGGSKLLTAGRGGAVITNDPRIAQRLKVFADRGNDAFPLSELQAAVLLPQLDIINEHNQTRRQRVALLLS